MASGIAQDENAFARRPGSPAVDLAFAGITADPFMYPWSSHRAYCGKETISWLCTGIVQSSFGNRADTARKRFEAFVMDGLGEGHRPEFHGHGGV